MNTFVQKWGNSLALRLPKALALEARISQGSLVDLRLDGRTLCIEVVASPPATLDALLSGVTEENIHSAVDTSDGVGLEVW